ncbi:MAG: hypothetical protein LIO62_06010, partial [Clostridiales bacterium]|nr:hypothetical protein [Clostridiales bacterium]
YIKDIKRVIERNISFYLLLFTLLLFTLLYEHNETLCSIMFTSQYFSFVIQIKQNQPCHLKAGFFYRLKAPD